MILLYLTVSWKVTECVIAVPALAVTVTVSAPTGVPGSDGCLLLPPLPPQPVNPRPIQTAKPTKTRIFKLRTRRFGRKHSRHSRAPAIGKPGLLSSLTGAVVEIVSVVVTALPLGVTLEGAKVHAASDGRPVQLKVIGVANVPVGVIVSDVLTLLPRETLNALSALATVKSETTPTVVVVSALDLAASTFPTPSVAML